MCLAALFSTDQWNLKSYFVKAQSLRAKTRTEIIDQGSAQKPSAQDESVHDQAFLSACVWGH